MLHFPADYSCTTLQAVLAFARGIVLLTQVCQASSSTGKATMNRFHGVGVLACLLIVATTDAGEAKRESGRKYFRANHGFDGGLAEMVDLTLHEGFDKVRTIDELAKFASKVPGAAGFTAHPQFESGRRHASAVLWYTKLTPTRSSWPLYLFDAAEAKKNPGAPAKASAVAAAEARVSGKLKVAQQLIDAGGSTGVKLPGDHHEQKALALAVMRLGGSFEHTGKFGAGNCAGCRTVVPGGNPSRCGLGVQNQRHWNCCGAPEDAKHCRYWELIKAQDDAERLN